MENFIKFKHEIENFNLIGEHVGNLLYSEFSLKNNCNYRCNDTLVCYVTHLIDDTLPAIELVAKLVGKQNLLLITKSSSYSTQYLEHLKSLGYHICPLVKDDFVNHPQLVYDNIKSYMSQKDFKQLLILDHGGYFSYHLEAYLSLPIIGIVEYALNGEKKYVEKQAKYMPNFEITSTGQSRLKNFSDHSCGLAIGEFIPFVCKQLGLIGARYHGIIQPCIIGYGKLGKGVAEALFYYFYKNILIYDTDPYKIIAACQDGFDISCKNIEDTISRSNIIVIGTDTAPIPPEYYSLMNHNTLIVTVTSADDSLNLPELIDNKVLTKVAERDYYTSYSTIKGHIIHLLCNGDAPNLALHIPYDDITIFLPMMLHIILGYNLLLDTRYDKFALEDMILKYYLDVYREFRAHSSSVNMIAATISN